MSVSVWGGGLIVASPALPHLGGWDSTLPIRQCGRERYWATGRVEEKRATRRDRPGALS